MRFYVSGERGALPDIVLDHGGGGSADDWSRVLPLLSPHARVLSYDRAGAGDSPMDDAGHGAAAVSARLHKLVDEAQVRKPFILVGYSLGGLYARYYAQEHPQDVAGLVLVDTTPVAMVIPLDKIRHAMRLVWLLHWAVRLGVASFYRKLGGKVGDVEKYERGMRRMAAPHFVDNMRRETAAIAGIQADVGRVAPQLRHPTLAVIASLMPKGTPPDEAARVRGMHEELAAQAPAPLSRLRVVEGSTHSTLMTDQAYAAQLAQHILAFARELAGRAS